jgi:hypothetical protein
VSDNSKPIMNTIRCPSCEYSSDLPAFHCVRCGGGLLNGITPEGTQIVLRFAGDMLARTIAVYHNHQPARLLRLEISGPTILLVLEGEISLTQRTSDLFEVLYKGEELWELR